MAASFAVTDRGAFGDLFTRLVAVTLDNSYPNTEGGYPITPQQLGFGLNGVVEFAIAGSWNSGTDRYSPVYDAVAGTIRIYKNGAEVADDTDLSAIGPVPLLVLGKGQG